MDNFFLDFFAAAWKIFSLILTSMTPLFIGLIFAYIMNPAVEWVRMHLTHSSSYESLYMKSPRGRVASIIITYLGLLLIIFSIIYIFIVLILGALPHGSLSDIAESIKGYFTSSYESVLSFFEEYIPFNSGAFPSDMDSHFSGWLRNWFSPEDLMSTIGNLLTGSVRFFIGIVASVYLLKDKEFFLSLWQSLLSRMLKQKNHGMINEILSEINDVLYTFIKGALIDSLIVALLSSVVLSLIKVKFSVVIGLLGGVLNIIPYFGPFFGMLPAFIVALATKGLSQALLAAAALFLVQQVDSNYIYPKVVGSSIGLHPLFVLLSVSVLGYFAGIPGMLAAVPAAGVLQIFIKRWAYSL